MLFAEKQAQVVNFNQLLEQMREGEDAKLKVNRMCNYLHSWFEREHKSFQEEIIDAPNTQVFYTWSYPFKAFGDTEVIEKFVEILGYSLSTEDKELLDKDYKLAVEHNRKIKNSEE